jgi:hypothetical protein
MTRILGGRSSGREQWSLRNSCWICSWWRETLFWHTASAAAVETAMLEVKRELLAIEGEGVGEVEAAGAGAAVRARRASRSGAVGAGAVAVGTAAGANENISSAPTASSQQQLPQPQLQRQRSSDSSLVGDTSRATLAAALRTSVVDF